MHRAQWHFLVYRRMLRAFYLKRWFGSGTKTKVRRLEDKVRVRCYTLGEIETNCYLVWSGASRQAMVIDPGGDVTVVLDEIARERLTVTTVVNTHGHADHIVGNGRLVTATRAVLAIGAADALMLTEAKANLSHWLGYALTSPPASRLLRHGDTLLVGEASFTVRATPGHTPGGVTLVGEGMAFTGDTLFAGGIGRTDLPGGDGEALLSAITREIMSLSDETVVYPGHGEATTVGHERFNNPFLAD